MPYSTCDSFALVSKPLINKLQLIGKPGAGAAGRRAIPARCRLCASAYTVLENALLRFRNPELLYDYALLAERLDKLELMEAGACAVMALARQPARV